MLLYFLIFLLLTAGGFSLLGISGESGKDGKNRRRYRTQGKLEEKLARLLHRAKSLIRGSKLPPPVYALMTAGCAIGGFLAGKFIYGSTLIAVALGVTFLLAPLLWLSFRETSSRSTEMDRLASSMMILSNSYLITEDFLTSVKENLEVLEAPEPFRDFFTYASYMDSSLRAGLQRMDQRVGNSYFSQWVDALIMAQEDRSLKYVTVSVVQSLNDALQVQRESDAAMYAVWRDYFLVLILIFSTPLVFRLLLADAYAAMTGTLIGQSLLLLLLAAVVFSVFRALKINRPLVV